MTVESGTPAVLFGTGAKDADGYAVFAAFALAYDPATQVVAYEPLTCKDCGAPVGKWDFQYSNRGSRNAYGVCSNEHMTILHPTQGTFEIV